MIYEIGNCPLKEKIMNMKATLAAVFEGRAWLRADGNCVRINNEEQDGRFSVDVYPNPEMYDFQTIFVGDRRAVSAFLRKKYYRRVPHWDE